MWTHLTTLSQLGQHEQAPRGSASQEIKESTPGSALPYTGVRTTRKEMRQASLELEQCRLIGEAVYHFLGSSQEDLCTSDKTLFKS